MTKLAANSTRARTHAAHHAASRMPGAGGSVARHSSRATRYGITRFATGMNQAPSGVYCGDAPIAAHNIRVPIPHAPVSYLEANAGAGPDRAAVLDAGRTVTFAELWDRVHAAAAALRERGVEAGDVVAVSLPN